MKQEHPFLASECSEEITSKQGLQQKLVKSKKETSLQMLSDF